MIRSNRGGAILAALLILGAVTTGIPQTGSGQIPPPPGSLRLPNQGVEPPEPRRPAPGTTRGVVNSSGPANEAELVSVERIWDRAAHNAFTDLIRFQERWYCAFREGERRISPEGAVRVISSADGAEWSSAFHVNSEYADIRDPKFSITPDRRLMLTATAAYNPPTEVGYQSLAWYTIDGRTWCEPFRIGDPEIWFWSVSWHRGSAYSMAYSPVEERFVQMYVGPKGLKFRPVGNKVIAKDLPTEATLLFDDDDSVLCLLRRDGGTGTTLLGRSRPPYRGWHWSDLGTRLAGPAIIRLPDDRIIGAGKLTGNREQTTLCWIDGEEATITPFLALPSGGDNGYPGLAYHDGMLWVSYYSSHDEKTAVYLAKVKLPPNEKEVP